MKAVNKDGVPINTPSKKAKRYLHRIGDKPTAKRIRDLLMIRLMTNGWTSSEIGSMLGISGPIVRKRVSLAIKETANDSMEPIWNKRRSSHNEEIVVQSVQFLRESGLSVSDISWVTGLGYSSIKRFL